MSQPRTVVAEPGSQTIAFSRGFAAPAARVFAAHTDPDLVRQWMGPRGSALTVREWDARTGGSWSTVVAGGGQEWAFFGSFHEVVAPGPDGGGRIVQTFEYEGDPGHPSFEVLTFTDTGDGTSLLEGVSVHLSVEDRDEMLKGMDSGRDEDFERLDELFAP